MHNFAFNLTLSRQSFALHKTAFLIVDEFSTSKRCFRIFQRPEL